MSSEGAAFVGFDVGGTKCAVCVGVKRAGRLEREGRAELPTPRDWRVAVDAMLRAAEELIGADHAPLAAGVSCGGPLDARAGVILSPPNLPGWDEVPIARMIGERLRVPAYLENDANACALAEWRFGAGAGADSLAFLTFGTGMGAGLILNGRLYRGASGDAGEVGHLRLERFGPSGYGKEGSFEGFCSGGGIAQTGATLARRALQRGIVPGYPHGDRAATAKEIADAARAGDATALEAFARCGEMLGLGLSAIVDLLNPERIVIGSIYERCEDLLAPAMREAMGRECLARPLRAVRVLPSALGDALGDVAALSVAEYGFAEAARTRREANFRA